METFCTKIWAIIVGNAISGYLIKIVTLVHKGKFGYHSLACPSPATYKGV